MIVVYKQSQSLEEVQTFFGQNNPTELPFVDSTLGIVSVSGWKALNTTKFYIPKNWTHLDDGSGSFVVYEDITGVVLDKELTVFTELGFLPLSIPHVEDLGPREVNKTDKLSFGYGFTTMKDFLLCKDIKPGNAAYIEYTLEDLADTILATIPGNEKEYLDASTLVSGIASVDSDSEILGNSRIYGPCLIVNSVVTNSTVYPGSVIINSRIANSSVEASYLENSGVTNTTLKDSLAYKSHLDDVKAEDSVFPRNSKINGK